MTTEEQQQNSPGFSRRKFLEKGFKFTIGGLTLGTLGGRLVEILIGQPNPTNQKKSTYHGDPARPVATSEVNTEGSPGLEPEKISPEELEERVKWALMFLREKVDNQDNTTVNHLISVLQQILTSENISAFKLADGRVYSRNRVLANSDDGSAPKPIEYKVNLCANPKIEDQTIVEIFCSYYGTISTVEEVDDHLPGLDYDNLNITLSTDGLKCYSFDSDYHHEFTTETELKYLIGRTANDLFNGHETPLVHE